MMISFIPSYACMTKIVCPTCGVQGYLQTRRNSMRVQHYLGYEQGKRKYNYHKITREYLESVEVNEQNGSKLPEVNRDNVSFKSQRKINSIYQSSGSIVRSSIAASRP